MKQIIHLTLVLTIICTVSSALLAAVYKLTKEPIELTTKHRTNTAAMAVMPATVQTPPHKMEIDGEVFYVAKEQDTLRAVAVTASSANGYGGTITIMVGLDAQGQVVDFQKIEANETPGLGTKVFDEAFKKQIRQRPFTANWRVDKDGGEIEAVASATISSRAILACIQEAIAKFQRASAELSR